VNCLYHSDGLKGLKTCPCLWCLPFLLLAIIIIVLKHIQTRWTDGGGGVGVYCHYHFLATCFQTFCFPSPICIWSSCTVMCHLGLSPAYRHNKHLKTFDVYWCFCFGLIISPSCCSFFICDPFANSLHALFVYCRFRAPCFTRIACMAQETCRFFRVKICFTHHPLICAHLSWHSYWIINHVSVFEAWTFQSWLDLFLQSYVMYYSEAWKPLLLIYFFSVMSGFQGFSPIFFSLHSFQVLHFLHLIMLTKRHQCV